MPKTFSKIALIGAGRVGTALALALKKKGLQIVFVSNSTANSTRKSALILKSREHSIRLSDIPDDTDIIIIAAPAQAIPKIVKELSQIRSLDYRGKFIFHTSGAHTSGLLEPLRRRGAKIASIHPIQSFPLNQKQIDTISSLKGIYYGIDAPPNNLNAAKLLVKLLGGKYVIIPEKLRPLYHALCVFSSGYLIQLLSVIEEISEQFNFSEPWYNILVPMMETSIRNSVKTSPASALTGPIMRGDLATIKLHIQAMRKYAPSAIKVYKNLGTDTARTALRENVINRAMYSRLLKILS
jgi:predicted short-subunit dehydrogenase-like oxidoreductase (DUF2520 family)